MATKKRLIDAYKLEELLRSNSGRYHHKDDIIAAIAGQPTVDAVEVVHGHMEEIEPCQITVDRQCCLCGTPMGCMDNYCPNCGTKMDGGNENG